MKNHNSLVSEVFEDFIIQPKVCGLNDSTFVLVWGHEVPFVKVHLKQQLFAKDGTPKGDPMIIVSYYPPEGLYPEIIPLGWGYMVSWISPLSHRLMGQYFDQGGKCRTDKTILMSVNDDYQLFQLSEDIFAVVSYRNVNGIYFTEFELSFHMINEYSSFKLYEQKEDWISAVNAEKIYDNKVAVVWAGRYDDYNIYGKIIQY